MAVFPELIPSTRTYSPGAFPHTAHRVYDGSETRVRHSSTVLGARLRLFFPALTTADLLLVITHYNGQRGRFLPFAIPDDLLEGTTTPADFTPAGHQWRYAAKPTAEDVSVDDGTNLHNLTVELETVPPENSIVQGARLRVRASLRPGSAQLGQFFDVTVTLSAGAIERVFDPVITVTLTAGAASGVGAFAQTATASLAAGAGAVTGGNPSARYIRFYDLTTKSSPFWLNLTELQLRDDADAVITTTWSTNLSLTGGDITQLSNGNVSVGIVVSVSNLSPGDTRYIQGDMGSITEIEGLRAACSTDLARQLKTFSVWLSDDGTTFTEFAPVVSLPDLEGTTLLQATTWLFSSL